MRTIAIVNQKGGCGKTITAINLSSLLAMASRRVLLIDMDPQGHATLGLMRDSSRIEKTIYDALTCEPVTRLGDILVTARENLHIAPADIMLAALPEELAGTPGQENRLSKALEEIRRDYDYIIIDCPPSVGPLTFNALKASSEAIIPVEPSFFSLHGIGMQLETLDLLARKAGHAIRARALITLYRGRHDFVKAVTEELRKHLADRSFNTVIRFSVKLSEAAARGVPVAEYSVRSAGFADYRAFTEEVLDEESAEERAASSTAVDVSEETLSRVMGSGIEETEFHSELLMEASPPAHIDGGVLFTLEAPGARCVQLAGDFNGWTPEGNEMQSNGRIWTKVVALSPGRHRYRYVVDGDWKSDPMNVEVEPAPWGGFNSVFILKRNDPRMEV